MNISHEILLQYIALIHKAALAPEKWQKVLRTGETLFGATASYFQGIDKLKPASTFSLVNGYSEKTLNLYEKEFLAAGRDIRINRLSAFDVLQPFSDSLFFEDTVFERDDFYQFNRDQAGTRYMMGLKLQEDARHYWGIGWNFPVGAQKPDKSHLDILGTLAPHLKNAIEVSWKLRHQNLISHGLLESLQHMQLALAVIDHELTIWHANGPFRAFLNDRSAIHDDGQKLHICDSRASGKIKDDLARVIGGQNGSCCQAVPTETVLRDITRKPSHIVTLIRLPAASRADFRFPVEETRLVLVSIQRVTCPQRTNTEKLHSRFDLTEAQARLASILSDGTSLKHAARELKIQYGTARAHLLKIFEKTGVHRQGDLLLLLQDPHLK